MRTILLLVVALISLSQTAPEGPAARIRRLAADARIQASLKSIEDLHDRMVAEIIYLNEIPAPPFKEEKRGAAFLQMLQQTGLTDVERDPIGNVMGLRRGSGPAGGPLVVIAAHLDTVFPEGTDVRVKREGTKLTAPGIGDNTRSLAVLLAMIRAMDSAASVTEGVTFSQRLVTPLDILFVGDVGEEGLGDLRGVKYLFKEGKYKDRIKQFIALDGSAPGDDIVIGAVGSRRYEVTFKGPGGHSYGAFGLVNPAFAMAGAIQRLSSVRVPESPKTTFNVGRVGGGTSINSIPKDLWMEVDMRSESPVELEKLETAFLAMLKSAVDEENRARSTREGAISTDVKLVGARPSGRTNPGTPIAQFASQAAVAAGLRPEFTFSSTDANLAISLGIPAIRLNSGGTGDRAHALEEWIDVEKTGSVRGIRIVLLTLLAAAGY